MTLQLKDLSHIIEPFSFREEITSIAVGGSLANGTSDIYSDIDIYVYNDIQIPLESRQLILKKIGDNIEMNQNFWEMTDTLIDQKTGKKLDIIYRNREWMVGEIRKVLVNYTPKLGYTTSIWDNLLHSAPIYDPSSWYRDLRQTSLVPFPFELMKSIVKHNHPVLRVISGSYLNQISQAVKRKDLININHRVTAFLSSYFDIIFAVNYSPNPGEKKIIEHVKKRCKTLPNNWEEDVTSLINLIPTMSNKIIEQINLLVDNLDNFLLQLEMI